MHYNIHQPARDGFNAPLRNFKLGFFKYCYLYLRPLGEPNLRTRISCRPTDTLSTLQPRAQDPTLWYSFRLLNFKLIVLRSIDLLYRCFHLWIYLFTLYWLSLTATLPLYYQIPGLVFTGKSRYCILTVACLIGVLNLLRPYFYFE